MLGYFELHAFLAHSVNLRGIRNLGIDCSDYLFYSVPMKCPAAHGSWTGARSWTGYLADYTKSEFLLVYIGPSGMS